MSENAALRPPRLLWLMIAAGKPVDSVLFGGGDAPGLADLLEAGDIVIDGGDSHCAEDAPQAERLAERGIGFLDCGTSGGPVGARTVGSGHFVKMVHNGIEYGMMQAIAEGFAVMHDSPRHLDLAAVADVYQHASVIESRLVGWLGSAYERYGGDLDPVSGTTGHAGEGAWAVAAGKEAGIPAPVIAASLQSRIDSETEPSYTGQVVQALRNEFGGHGPTPKQSK